MEKYIQKINNKITQNDNIEHAKKIKKTYQIVGGVILGIGVTGFLASFITFMVLFFDFKTDDAFVAWIVAIPFLIFIVAGSVLTRIGDALLPELKKTANHLTKESNKIDTNNQQEKK